MMHIINVFVAKISSMFLRFEPKYHQCSSHDAAHYSIGFPMPNFGSPGGEASGEARPGRVMTKEPGPVAEAVH